MSAAPARIKSFCRNCSALCGLELAVEDGRITGVFPEPTAPSGGYLCPKGIAAAEFQNGAEDRLVESLKRRPDGSFAPIAAADAIAEIGDKLADLMRRHGPRSIALYHGTGAYRATLGALMERAFRAAIDTPNFFSTMTIDQSAKWVTMGRMGMMASGKPRLADVDLAVIVGNNPVVSHQAFPFIAGECGAPGRNFERAKERGTRIIVIDPRRTETARHADLLIQPLPGHDATLFAAIAHVLLRDRTYNAGFCERFVSQIEALRHAVARFTPAFAAARAGITAEEIELAARWIGEAKRPLVGSGSGPSFADHSNLADHMIEAVNALVGGYRRAGDLVRNPGTLKPGRPVERAIPPARTWERGETCRSAAIGHLMGEFPSALIPDEIMAPAEDRIRALIVLGGNPLMAIGDPDHTIPAFDSLELLVSLDGRLNETASHAHYVIATAQQFEREDLTVPSDGAFPEAFAQYTPAVVPAPPGVIEDWEFYHDVAARMGVPLTFKFWGYGMDFAANPRGLPLDGSARPTSRELIEFLCGEGDVTFADLLANPAGFRPQRPPQYVLAAEDTGDRLEICPADVAAELGELAQEQPDTRYTFRLTSRRNAETLNGAFRESRGSRKRHSVNFAFLNREDMAAQGIAEGDTIEIASPDGAIRAVARAEDRLRRGVVSMSHMFGRMRPGADPRADGGSYTGALTSLGRTDLQAINFMPRYSAIPVNVRVVAQENDAPGHACEPSTGSG